MKNHDRDDREDEIDQYCEDNDCQVEEALNQLGYDWSDYGPDYYDE